MKKVAVVKEQFPGERRVALLPENVEKLIAAGYEVLVEEGAGEAAGRPLAGGGPESARDHDPAHDPSRRHREAQAQQGHGRAGAIPARRGCRRDGSREPHCAAFF